MSALVGFAALTLLAAAVLATLAHSKDGAAFAWPSRLIALVGAAALLPAAAGSGTRFLALIGIASAIVPRPLALLLGAAAASMLAMGGGTAATPALLAGGLCALAAAAAVGSSAASDSAAGRDSAALLASAGGVLAAVLLALPGHGVLRWRLVLDTQPGLELADAGLLLGLALLSGLAGTLVLLACLAAGTAGLARQLGQRALLLASGFAVLGAGLGISRAVAERPAVLAAGASVMAGLLAATGGLVLALVVHLGDGVAGDAGRLAARAVDETRAAAVLAVLAAATAVGMAFWSEGSYLQPRVASALAVALLGLAALQTTRLGMLRRLALLAGALSLAIG